MTPRGSLADGEDVAELQASVASGKPILLRVEYQGGHGGIGGTEKQGGLPTSGASALGAYFHQDVDGVVPANR
jgi:hypothetical protein